MPPKPPVANQTVRLNKYIADCTASSRRHADTLIETKQVRVNGRPATLGQGIVPGKDKVTLDGKLMILQRKLYVLFHKPTGLITTRHDPEGRQTIYDKLPERYHHLDPVGRLDRESSGVLLLSNDGNFVQRLSHPKYAHAKVYRVQVNKPVTEAALLALEKGILLEPENTVAQAKVQEVRDLKTVILVLKTGLNRQIRRSFEHLGYEVKSIKRLSVAGIVLGNLKAGQSRELKPAEVRPFLKVLRSKPSGIKPAKPKPSGRR